VPRAGEFELAWLTLAFAARDRCSPIGRAADDFPFCNRTFAATLSIRNSGALKRDTHRALLQPYGHSSRQAYSLNRHSPSFTQSSSPIVDDKSGGGSTMIMYDLTAKHWIAASLIIFLAVGAFAFRWS
jgi:hypothetical protein